MRETITILGFVQSLFGILIFISKRPRHLSFILLTVWLSVNAIFLGAQLLPFEVVDYFKPGIFPLLFLLGPLLYLYVNSLATENYKLEPKHFLHLLPYLAVCIHRSVTDAVSISSSSNLDENPAFIYNKIYYVLLIVSLFIYWVFSVRIILAHRKNIPYYFSNYTKKNTLSWLIFVVLIFLVLFLADLFVTSLARVFGIDLFQFLSITSNLTIFTFIMLFFGINQSVIYEFKNENEETSEGDTEEKYKRSALNENKITDINNKVFDYLKTKKPYLNSEFSFQMMVDDLGISRQNLSQVINSGQKKNFYKLISGFRVEEVKEMLANPKYEHYTVLGIAFDCGFNSKTSFNRIFKEETGYTPTEYKKSL
jgi:AraC-like DNA-binding protein